MRFDVFIRGSRMRYMVPKVLFKHGLLRTFFTDAYGKDGIAPLLKLLSKVPFINKVYIKKYLQRDPGIPREHIVAVPVFNIYKEIVYRLTPKDYMSQIRSVIRFMSLFNKKFISRIESGIEGIYGINGDSLELFIYGKRVNPKCSCVLEQCILPYRLQVEIYKNIDGYEWDSSIDVDYIALREESEWRLADKIIAPSGFVKEGLLKLGVPSSKIHVVPYCTDTQYFDGVRRTSVGGACKILFVGAITSRKGLRLIADILRNIDFDYECILAGSKVEDFTQSFVGLNATFLGTVPSDKVKQLYKWADIFLFPTYIEGSANVVYEAMASGLPVITTKNCGSVITDGVDGFVVDQVDNIGSYNKVIRELVQDAELYSYISGNAIEVSKQYDITTYGERLLNVLT